MGITARHKAISLFAVCAIVVSTSTSFWLSQTANHEEELEKVNAGEDLLRSYRNEVKMIDEPVDAENGSLYSAPFRFVLI